MSLELRGITKDFRARDGGTHRAVDDVSLTVERGTFCTLLGPSGCGKTTLLRIVAGFEEATSGDVLHNGHSLAGVPPYRRGFPMVFQSYALFPHMTVAENVAYGLRVRKLGAAEREERVASALALLGLTSMRGRHPAQLSGGQQQRVALARCLVLEPEIILLDEPLSNLDAGLRVEMRREIRALQQRLGITAIYVTHDQEEALAISDRVLVMNAGRIEQDGTPADIYHAPRSEFVARFMGFSNIFPGVGTAEGVRVLGAEYPGNRHAPGEAVTVVIRSDAVRRSADGGLRGAVVESAFLGSRVRSVVALDDGSRITVDEAAGAGMEAPRAGDEVVLEIDAAGLHVIPANPDRRSG